MLYFLIGLFTLTLSTFIAEVKKASFLFFCGVRKEQKAQTNPAVKKAQLNCFCFELTCVLERTDRNGAYLVKCVLSWLAIV